MKAILLFLAAGILLTGCRREEPNPFYWDDWPRRLFDKIGALKPLEGTGLFMIPYGGMRKEKKPQWGAVVNGGFNTWELGVEPGIDPPETLLPLFELIREQLESLLRSEGATVTHTTLARLTPNARTLERPAHLYAEEINFTFSAKGGPSGVAYLHLYERDYTHRTFTDGNRVIGHLILVVDTASLEDQR